jgi:hypothetical protein
VVAVQALTRPRSTPGPCDAGCARAAAQRAAVTHAAAERESVSDELGVGCAVATGWCDSTSALRSAEKVVGDVASTARDVTGGLGAKPPYRAEETASEASRLFGA